MRVDLNQLQELRSRTGIGVMDCKRVLEETAGDFQKALVLLQDMAAKKAEKKVERTAAAGIVDSYIHGEGRIGVLIEVHCETDFLAKSTEFKELVRALALQIASEAPQYLCAADVPPDVVHKIESEAEATALAMEKPPAVVAKMKAGKVRKFCKEACLLEQPFIKEPDITVGNLLQRFIAKSGELVQVAHFTRYQIS